MKFSQGTIAAFTALIQVSTADFVLYLGIAGGNGISPNFYSWKVVEPNPDCDALPNVPMWEEKDDVNEHNGLRCEGDGCSYGNDPNDIDVLEMRFSGLLHWSKCGRF